MPDGLQTIPNPTALQIAGLAAVFSSRATSSLKAVTVEAIERAGYQAEIAEAVARLIHRREKSTFPMPAEILAACAEVRGEHQAARGGIRYELHREEMRELARRRLRFQKEPVNEDEIEREIKRMLALGWSYVK